MPRGKARKRPGPEEIPQLKAMGLTAVKTTGYGNCLFHALSDQLYGDQSRHATLRADTVQYMRDHPDDFKDFVIANPGGGIRRNPKRKNAGTLNEEFDPTPPSEADINTAFALSLESMARGGTYGDNAEIIAFSSRYHLDIRIWSAGMGAFLKVDCDALPGETLPTLYIVHHTYEHYSSIRNIDGPFTGLPEVKIKTISPEAQRQLQRELAEGPAIEQWMVDLAMSSLPYDANQNMVVQTLKQCRGNVNLAVDLLLPDSSPDTSSRSSSLERDPDSDDEGRQRSAKKRQDRRSARPHPLSKNLVVRQHRDGEMSSPDARSIAVALKKVDRSKQGYDPDETEEEDWKEDGPYHDSESASVSTSASEFSSTPDQSQSGGFNSIASRARLSQPKFPDLTDLRRDSHSSNPERPFSTDMQRINMAKAAHRTIAKPRRRRAVNGAERAADLAKKSARNQHLANHASANNNQQENTPVLGIKAIQI